MMPPGCLPLEGLLDLEHPGDILRPIWLEDFPKRSWKTLLGRGTSGLPCSGCCYCDLDKWQKMDGWMVERVKVRNVMVPNWPCNLKTCRPPVHHSPPPSVNESSKNRAVLDWSGKLQNRDVETIWITKVWQWIKIFLLHCRPDCNILTLLLQPYSYSVLDKNDLVPSRIFGHAVRRSRILWILDHPLRHVRYCQHSGQMIIRYYSN